MTSLQTKLDELASQNDNRTSVFDVHIQDESNSHVTLSGRVLNESQLDEVRRSLPSLNLDTASIRILSRSDNERIHVATNLTGLYERPTFGMPLSSELCFGTALETLEENGRWIFTRQRDGYLGWAYRPYLGEGRAPEATHLVLAPVIELRAEPDERSGDASRKRDKCRLGGEAGRVVASPRE